MEFVKLRGFGRAGLIGFISFVVGSRANGQRL